MTEWKRGLPDTHGYYLILGPVDRFYSPHLIIFTGDGKMFVNGTNIAVEKDKVTWFYGPVKAPEDYK